jgi:hypothetical protein
MIHMQIFEPATARNTERNLQELNRMTYASNVRLNITYGEFKRIGWDSAFI